MKPYFLALDAGTGSGRAAVFDGAGELLACEQEEWSYDSSQYPGDLAPGYHFDPERFWQILCAAARRALERSGVAAREIVGIAATSQREGCVFLGADGRELLATPNFDARGAVEGVEILERIGLDRLYRITGHTPPLIFPLSRLLWWRKRFPDVGVASVLMISDWVTYRLTGERVAEPTNAAESMLYDLEKRDWSDEICEAFEIPRSILPALLTPGARAGSVGRDAAARAGLVEGTPVFVGGADTQCALFGAGVVGVGETGAVLGTTAPVQLVCDRPVLDDQSYLWGGAHVVPDRWVLESNAGDGGKAFLWLLELLDLKPDGQDAFARIAAEAAAANPEIPVYSYFGPSIFNLRTMNPGKAAGILFPYPFGRQRPGRRELVLGFLESLAFAVQANLEQIEAVAGRKVERLSVSGGMTRSPLVVRLISEVTGLPTRASRVPETAALGCAMLAGLGAGVYADVEAALVAAVRSDEIVSPERGHSRERYRKWRELYAVLERTTVP